VLHNKCFPHSNSMRKIKISIFAPFLYWMSSYVNVTLGDLCILYHVVIGISAKFLTLRPNSSLSGASWSFQHTLRSGSCTRWFRIPNSLNRKITISPVVANRIFEIGYIVLIPNYSISNWIFLTASKRGRFPFLWVPELSPYHSHRNSRLAL
jgi:hypothetical protein